NGFSEPTRDVEQQYASADRQRSARRGSRPGERSPRRPGARDEMRHFPMEYVLLVFKPTAWDRELPSNLSTMDSLSTHHAHLPIGREERASGQGGAGHGLVFGEISLVVPVAWFRTGVPLGRYVPCASVRSESGEGERLFHPEFHAGRAARRHPR